MKKQIKINNIVFEEITIKRLNYKVGDIRKLNVGTVIILEIITTLIHEHIHKYKYLNLDTNEINYSDVITEQERFEEISVYRRVK